jgi:hypothetical protein
MKKEGGKGGKKNGGKQIIKEITQENIPRWA